MAMFEVVLNGAYHGQDIKNILWYRGDGLPDLIDLFLDYEQALAEEVYDNIWLSGADIGFTGVSLKEIMSEEYQLVSIQVTGRDEGFVLLGSDPYVRDVNEFGNDDGAMNGPAVCAIVRANLQPAAGPGIGLPRNGYWAIGPLPDEAVDTTGHLTETWTDWLHEVGNRMAAVITTELPVGGFTAVKVRVSKDPLGVITDIGWKNILDTSVRPLASFRRSRQPEA